MNLTSALILSDKSSGSSVLQRELAKHSDINLMSRPPHQEGETLYWSKAAAVLGLPQPAMMDSTVLPMKRAAAQQAVQELVRDNLSQPDDYPTDKSGLFATWRDLTSQYGPVFLEKSPHHLHNRAVLELLLEAQRDLTEISFRYIGLVRNPVDTLYSMWKRWKTVPEAREGEWCRTYGNLLWLKEVAPQSTHIVRYEDLVSDPDAIRRLCDFVGVSWQQGMGDALHRSSLQAWRSDASFGYTPGDQVRAIAAAFNYEEADLETSKSWAWPARREVGHRVRRARLWVGSRRRQLRR